MKNSIEQQNPFVGLRPFENDDSLYFFGRDSQVKALLQRLYSTRFLAVIGSSGSGKSSLIRAGLIPNLEAGFLVQERDHWAIASMKSGDTPIHNLAIALLEANSAAPEQAAEFAQQIAELGVQAIIDHIIPILTSNNANLLLLVDQFEEIFRFGMERKAGKNYIHPEASDFVALLLRLIEQDDYPIYVCLTMRSDFLGECDIFYRLPEAMNRSQYLVPRLTREQRKEAIIGPVHLSGTQLSARLLDRLLNENIDNRDDLPVLQHALMRTWDNWAKAPMDCIDIEHYENIHSIQHALNDHADEALAELNPEQQKLAKQVFQLLTDIDASNRRIRRPAHLSELVEVTGQKAQAIIPIITCFRADRRSFLVFSTDNIAVDPLIDISHESLIRQWEQLAEWVDEEVNSAKIYQRLADTAASFSGKDGVYQGAELEQALHWQTQQNPNAAWASRYSGDYQQAMDFLQASLKRSGEVKRDKQKAKLAEQELIQQRRDAKTKTEKIRSLKWFSALVLSLLLVASGLGWYSYLQVQTARAMSEQASFNLAKMFEAKANQQLETALRSKTNRDIQQSWLYTTTALTQPIAESKNILTTNSVSQLFYPVVIEYLFAQRWFSPTMDFGSITSIAFSPDGQTLVSGDEENRVRLWDINSGVLLEEFLGHSDKVTSVAFSSDGASLVSGSWDRSLRLWDVASGQLIQQFNGHTGAVYSVAFSPDGNSLLSGSADNTVRLWDIASAKLSQQFDGHTAGVNSVIFSPDGLSLLSASSDKSIRLWDIESSQLIKQFTGHTDTVLSIAFSPDEKSFVSASADTSIRLWEIATAKQSQQFIGHTASIFSVVFSPDGKSILSGSGDKTVRLWAITGQLLQEFKAHSLAVFSVAFTPDGKFLASGSPDKSIKLWAISPHKLHSKFAGHNDAISSVAYNIDGHTIASGSSDNSIKLWDSATGKLLHSLDGHDSHIFMYCL